MCCSCNLFPKFVKFWTLLLILSSPGLFNFFKSVVEVQFSLLFRRLNDLVLSFPCEEFLTFFIFRWFYLSLSKVSWRMNRGISILCNWSFGRKTMNVPMISPVFHRYASYPLFYFSKLFILTVGDFVLSLSDF